MTTTSTPSHAPAMPVLKCKCGGDLLYCTHCRQVRVKFILTHYRRNL